MPKSRGPESTGKSDKLSRQESVARAQAVRTQASVLAARDPDAARTLIEGSGLSHGTKHAIFRELNLPRKQGGHFTPGAEEVRRLLRMQVPIPVSTISAMNLVSKGWLKRLVREARQEGYTVVTRSRGAQPTERGDRAQELLELGDRVRDIHNETGMSPSGIYKRVRRVEARGLRTSVEHRERRTPPS